MKKDNEKKKDGFILKILKGILGKLFSKIIFILILVGAVVYGGKMAWQKLGEVKTEKSSAIVFRELEKCAELATIKNSYSDVISIKKSRIAGLAKTYSIVKYTGIIRGGISDISKAKISVSNRGKCVKVELPPVEVLSNDISAIEVFDESSSAFVSISVQEIMAEIRFNQESASAGILETGFLEEAKSHAKEITETILFASGFEDVSVKFKE